MPVWIISSAASAWGLVMALAPILQIKRMVRQGSSRDVSLGYFSLLIPGFLLWVAHGYATADAFLIVPNALAALTAAALIGVAVWLRSNPRPEEGPLPPESRMSR